MITVTVIRTAFRFDTDLDAVDTEQLKADVSRSVEASCGVPAKYVRVTILVGSVTVIVEITVPPSVSTSSVQTALQNNYVETAPEVTRANLGVPDTWGSPVNLGISIGSNVIPKDTFPLPPPTSMLSERGILIITLSSIVGLIFLALVARECSSEQLTSVAMVLVSFASVFRRNTTRRRDESQMRNLDDSIPAVKFRAQNKLAQTGHSATPPKKEFEV
jgi:hypothetical protein